MKLNTAVGALAVLAAISIGVPVSTAVTSASTAPAAVAATTTQSGAPAPPAGDAPNSPDALGVEAKDLAGLQPAAMEDVYTPINTCRIVNTSVAGGKFANNETRSFKVRGTSSLAAQGGSAGGCAIPNSATSLTVVVTTLDSTTGGRLIGYPTGTPSVYRFASYIKGEGAAAAILKIAPSTSASPLTIKNIGGSTHVVIDVTGYYAPQIHAMIAYNGPVYSGSPRVLLSERLGTGSYRVTVDRDVTNCTPISSIHGGPFFASAYISGGYVYANTYDAAGAAVDLYWTLDVIC